MCSSTSLVGNEGATWSGPNGLLKDRNTPFHAVTSVHLSVEPSPIPCHDGGLDLLVEAVGGQLAANGRKWVADRFNEVPMQLSEQL